MSTPEGSTEPTAPPAEPRVGLTWRKVGVRGAIAVAALFVILMIIEQFINPFVVTFVVVFLVGAWWANRGGRGGLIFLAIISVVFVIMNIPFIIPSLSAPASWLDFTSTTFILLGTITAAVGSIAALRSGSVETAGPRTFSRVIGALVVIAIVVSAVATFTFDDATKQEGDIALTAQDTEFSTETLDADSGPVAVYIENKDPFLHTFTIDDLDVDVTIPSGSSVRVVFDAEPGEYKFYCRPHKPDMHGELTVQ